jgi:hypothetical protein
VRMDRGGEDEYLFVDGRWRLEARKFAAPAQCQNLNNRLVAVREGGYKVKNEL